MSRKAKQLATYRTCLSTNSHKGAAYAIDGPSEDHIKKLSDSRKDLFEDHSSRRGSKRTIQHYSDEDNNKPNDEEEA